MQEIWKQFVYDLREAKQKSVNESVYHFLIEGQFKLLGWLKLYGEICHKPNIPIGNTNFIQPDILIRKDDEDLFVIEVKKPDHVQTERERQQLESYMRQLKLAVGIYIGEHIEVYYDKPGEKEAISVLKINMELDAEDGTQFIKLFSKSLFNKEDLINFCEKRLQEKKRKEGLNKIKEILISEEGQCLITEIIKQYLTKRHSDSYTEEDIEEVLSTLRFKAVPKEETSFVQPILNKSIPFNEERSLQSKRIYDYTKYSLNGSNPLGKGKFVLAVVKEYIKQHPEATFFDIERTFPPQYQGSCGVVRTKEYVAMKGYDSTRFYENAPLFSADGKKFFVCTQWGIGNINNMVKKARELGFTVTIIS